MNKRTIFDGGVMHNLFFHRAGGKIKSAKDQCSAGVVNPEDWFVQENYCFHAAKKWQGVINYRGLASSYAFNSHAPAPKAKK